MHGPSDGVPRRDVPEVPREVGGHIVEEEIGSSADGVVYRARRNRLPVALKVLHRGSGADRTLIERLSRGSPRRIRHPNLPIIEAFGEADERLWYSTKYLRGDTLRRAIDDIIGGAVGRPSFGPLAPSFDGSLPPDLLSRATRLIADLAEGLGRAHAEGLVHRRIDPDHLIFSPAGRLVALNFDGRPISPPSDLATHRSDEVSPWIYRAPELLRGGDASPQADVWSLGAILYELITLRPIYRVE
ncbi:MAG TPA: protein kinase, partial [Planctomycetota bacterium]|nr:protein kinase [Planctomycetota bacterium]